MSEHETPAAAHSAGITEQEVQRIVSITVNAIATQFKAEMEEMISELREANKQEIKRIDRLLDEHEGRIKTAVASANGAAGSVEMLTEQVTSERNNRNSEYSDLKNLISGWRGEFEGWKTARDEAHTEHRENVKRIDREVDELANRVNGTENTVGLMAQQQAQNVDKINANNSAIMEIRQYMGQINKRLDEQADTMKQLTQPSAPRRAVQFAVNYALENPKKVAAAIAIAAPSIGIIIDVLSRIVR